MPTALSAVPPPPVAPAAGAETYPRWVRWVTHAAVLPPLPSGLWRIAMAVGIPVGFSEEQLSRGHVPGWGSVYLVALSAVAEGLALLALGFIRPWGVVFPRWMPLLGGRRVPPAAAIVPASAAAAVLTLGTVLLALDDRGFNSEPEPGFPAGTSAVVMAACYAPLLAWGPLLAAATAGYCLRIRRLNRQSSQQESS
jgi:hypothetical protein